MIARGLFAWCAGAEGNMGVNFDGEGGSDTTCMEATPMLLVNNAIGQRACSHYGGPCNGGVIAHCDLSFSAGC